MGIRTITIPAAGTWQPFPIKGLSLYTWDMPVYSGPDQQPRLAFEDKSNPKWPLVLQSTYGAQEEFGQIWIQGTSESAGDTIEFLVYGDCRETRINEQGYNLYEAQAGTTQQQTLSDSVFEWTEIGIQNAEGKLPKSVLVSSSNNSIMLAFNADPGQGAGGLGHRIVDGTSAGQHFIEIEGLDFILAARFINRTNGTNSVLNYTFRY